MWFLCSWEPWVDLSCMNLFNVPWNPIFFLASVSTVGDGTVVVPQATAYCGKVHLLLIALSLSKFLCPSPPSIYSWKESENPVPTHPSNANTLSTLKVQPAWHIQHLQNHRITWLGMDLNDHQISIPLVWAGTPSTRRHLTLMRFMVLPSPSKSSKVDVLRCLYDRARRYNYSDTNTHICNNNPYCSMTSVIFHHGKVCWFTVPSGKTMPNFCWITVSSC